MSRTVRASPETSPDGARSCWARAGCALAGLTRPGPVALSPVALSPLVLGLLVASSHLLASTSVAAAPSEAGRDAASSGPSSKAEPDARRPSPERGRHRPHARRQPPRARGGAELLGPTGREMAAVRASWGQESELTSLPVRFLERGDVLPIALPAAAADTTKQGCTTLLVLGPRNLSFVLGFSSAEAADHRAWPVPSVAGLAEVTRCGPRRRLLRELEVAFRSPRGVLQFLVAQGPEPPPQAIQILGERNPGPALPSPRIGPRPRLGAIRPRLEARTARRAQASAQTLRTDDLPADSSGNARSALELGPGCHVLDLLSEDDADGAVDMDARLLRAETSEVVALDETSPADSVLQLCVGRPERLLLEIRGAAPDTSLALLVSSWQLPPGIPLVWGAVARSALASALFDTDSGLPRPETPPVLSSLGVSGSTRLSFEPLPGSCYVAAVGSLKPTSARFGLGLRQGARRRQASSGELQAGTSLTFCADATWSAELEVQATGREVAWILGVWQLDGPRPRGASETP